MEHVKIVLAALFGMVAAVEEAKSNDGKYTLADLYLLAGPGLKIPAAFEAAKSAEVEYKKATGEQRAELITWIKQNFDIKDDKVETKIEAGLAMAVHAGELFS